MRRVTVKGFGGFHQRLGQSWVWMDGQGDVFGGGTHLDGQDTFRNQFRSAVSDDADAEDALGLRVYDELRQSVGTVEGQGASGCGPEKLGDLYFGAFFLGGGLGQTTPGDFRIGEHDGGND